MSVVGLERTWAPRRPVVPMSPPNLAVLAHTENTFAFGLGMANLATSVVIVGLFVLESRW